VAAAVAGAGYGVFLIVAALRLPAGADLTGQFPGQPAVKALTAVLLAAAALSHPIARERRWLVGALVFSAAGDFLLAMPWWQPSFVLGLAAFRVAHLCFLAALFPLARRSTPRLVAVAITVVDRAGRGVVRGVGFDDRDQPVRARRPAAGGADLVGVRGVAAADHRRVVLRPDVRAFW
jgi:hypothetical protein